MRLNRTSEMTWREAWFAMLDGKHVKLPSWSGYWAWEGGTIMMHTKEGSVIDLRATKNPSYTFFNMACEQWMIVPDETEEN